MVTVRTKQSFSLLQRLQFCAVVHPCDSVMNVRPRSAAVAEYSPRSSRPAVLGRLRRRITRHDKNNHCLNAVVNIIVDIACMLRYVMMRLTNDHYHHCLIITLVLSLGIDVPCAFWSSLNYSPESFKRIIAQRLFYSPLVGGK